MLCSSSHRQSAIAVMFATATVTAASIASTALGAGDPVGYTGFSAFDLSDELGTPDGLVTYRIIAHFDVPDTRVVACGSGLGDRDHLIVVTDDPEGIRNFGGILAGSPLEDFPGVPFSEPWDSWVTIEATNFISQWNRFSPGFLGGEFPAIKGNSLWETDAAWLLNQTGTPIDATDVPLAQFTIANDASLFLEMHVAWNNDFADFTVDRIRWSNADTPFERNVPSCARTDIDGDGIVGFSDVLAIVTEWGDGVPTWRPIGNVGSLFTEIQGCSFELPPVIDSRPTGDGSVTIRQSSALGGSTIDATYSARVAYEPGTTGPSITVRADASLLAADECLIGSPARGWAIWDAGYDVQVNLPTAFEWTATCGAGLVVAVGRVDADGTIGSLATECNGPTAGILEPGRYRVFIRDELQVGDDADSASGMVEGRLVLLNDDDHLGSNVAWRDINGDDAVGMDDLMAVLSTWGPACPE